MTGLLWLDIWGRNFQKQNASYFQTVVTLSFKFCDTHPWA